MRPRPIAAVFVSSTSVPVVKGAVEVTTKLAESAKDIGNQRDRGNLIIIRLLFSRPSRVS